MKTIQTRRDRLTNLRSERILKTDKLLSLFKGIRNGLRNEQKLLILGRKTRQETENYFNFMKFLFGSPDRVT